MKTAARRKLKAQLTVVLVAGCMTQLCALLLYIVAGLTVGAITPAAFGLFGAATALLAHHWVQVDVRRAFEKAVKQRYVVLEGNPPHITQIAGKFSGRWLAVLYIQLHPELIEGGML